MQLLKQSTSKTIRIGPFVDDTDGKTAETGLTISQADIRLSKEGGDFAQTNDASGATHDENGWYYLTLDATDTNTLGRLDVAISESGALPVWREYMVVTAHVYDTFCSTDYLQVDVIQVEGSDATDQIRDSVVDDSTRIDASQLNTHTAITAASIRTEIDSNSTQLSAIVTDTNELQTDDVPGLISALNDPTAAAIADAVWDEDVVAAHNTGDTAGAFIDDIDDILTDTAEIGTAGAGLTAVPWNASWDAEVESEVDDALGGGTGTALTAIPWNAAWDAEVQSECTDALNAYDPPTRAELTSDISGLNDPTAAAIADAVWDELSTGHTDAGKAGTQLWTDVDAILVDTAEIGAAGAGLTAVPWNSSWDAEVQSEVDDSLNTQLSDSIPADGTIPTLKQAIYMVVQFLNERSVSGTTVTVKKVDGSTSLYTLTLSDSSDPTSITRAT